MHFNFNLSEYVPYTIMKINKFGITLISATDVTEIGSMGFSDKFQINNKYFMWMPKILLYHR